MAFLLGAIGILGMLGNVGAAGHSAGASSAQLRSAIADVRSQNRDWNDKYASLLTANQTVNNEIQQDMIKILENHTKLASAIKLEKDNFNQQYKRIQIVGIIFVTFIFFLLLLKEFGLFQPIWDIITTPERYLWNAIFHKENVNQP